MLGSAYGQADSVFSIMHDAGGIPPYELDIVQKWGVPFTIAAGSNLSQSRGSFMTLVDAGAQGGEICFPVRIDSNQPFAGADGEVHWCRFTINESDPTNPLTLAEHNIVNVATTIGGFRRSYTAIATRTWSAFQVNTDAPTNIVRIFDKATGNEINSFIGGAGGNFWRGTDGVKAYFLVGTGALYTEVSQYDVFPQFVQDGTNGYSSMHTWGYGATGYAPGTLSINNLRHVNEDGSVSTTAFALDRSFFFPLPFGGTSKRVLTVNSFSGRPVHFGGTLYMPAVIEAIQVDAPPSGTGDVSRSYVYWSGLMSLSGGTASPSVRFSSHQIYDPAPIPGGSNSASGPAASDPLQSSIVAAPTALRQCMHRKGGFIGAEFAVSKEVIPGSGVYGVQPLSVAGGTVIGNNLRNIVRFSPSGSVVGRTDLGVDVQANFQSTLMSVDGAHDVVQFVDGRTGNRHLSIDSGASFFTTTALPNLSSQFNWTPLFTVR